MASSNRCDVRQPIGIETSRVAQLRQLFFVYGFDPTQSMNQRSHYTDEVEEQTERVYVVVLDEERSAAERNLVHDDREAVDVAWLSAGHVRVT